MKRYVCKGPVVYRQILLYHLREKRRGERGGGGTKLMVASTQFATVRDGSMLKPW